MGAPVLGHQVRHHVNVVVAARTVPMPHRHPPHHRTLTPDAEPQPVRGHLRDLAPLVVGEVPVHPTLATDRHVIDVAPGDLRGERPPGEVQLGGQHGPPHLRLAGVPHQDVVVSSNDVLVGVLIRATRTEQVIHQPPHPRPPRGGLADHQRYRGTSSTAPDGVHRTACASIAAIVRSVAARVLSACRATSPVPCSNRSTWFTF